MYWRTIQADCNQRSRKTFGFSQSGHNCSVLYGTDAARRAGADDLYDVKYKNQFLGDEVISRGTVNSSLVSPRDLILAAFRHRAVYMILVHNHPSGNPEPSKDDLLFTKRVWEAGALVDIPLLDHIVIGDQQYFSFRQEGLLS